MKVIVKPILTEKRTRDSEKSNRFGFVVSPDANKVQIKEAVEKMYSVTVQSVSTQNYVGKVKTRNTTQGLAIGRVNRNKRAIVTLKQGDTIDFYASI